MPRKRPHTKAAKKRLVRIKNERRLKKKGQGVGAAIRGMA